MGKGTGKCCAWVVVILNALGIAGGFLYGRTAVYVLFGMSFVARFHKYAVIAWNLIYEKESYLVDDAGKANMVIANELVCVICLTGIYLMAAIKGGFLCVILSMLQSLFFQMWENVRRGEGGLAVLLSLAAEFFLIFLIP